LPLLTPIHYRYTPETPTNTTLQKILKIILVIRK